MRLREAVEEAKKRGNKPYDDTPEYEEQNRIVRELAAAVEADEKHRTISSAFRLLIALLTLTLVCSFGSTIRDRV